MSTTEGQVLDARAQALGDQYKHRFSILPPPHLHLQARKCSTRQRLAGSIHKLKRKVRDTSTELQRCFLDKRIKPSDHGLGSQSVEKPSDALPLCSIPGCDHAFCLPPIPKDYDLTVGHGIEDDHDSIDYSFGDGKKYRVIEPDFLELRSRIPGEGSGSWPGDLARHSSPAPRNEERKGPGADGI
ncbi:hypothetical protein Slin14017_G033320 [Septoria linicola]|nr:hypothetical protein Slin14017_G033320 [Septoria linicola]